MTEAQARDIIILLAMIFGLLHGGYIAWTFDFPRPWNLAFVVAVSFFTVILWA